MINNVHGIDHVGLSIPDIDAATQFFQAAFDAIVLYDTLKKDTSNRNDPTTHKRLGISSDMTEVAIRMLKLPNGPGLELFEFRGPDQKQPISPADIGWTHIAIYVDDIYAALEKAEKAGAKRNADPLPLAGIEAGDGNMFCYIKTPWGSSLELISYPSRQAYLNESQQRKWPV